jgi:hypothetical protein
VEAALAQKKKKKEKQDSDDDVDLGDLVDESFLEEDEQYDEVEEDEQYDLDLDAGRFQGKKGQAGTRTRSGDGGSGGNAEETGSPSYPSE